MRADPNARYAPDGALLALDLDRFEHVNDALRLAQRSTASSCAAASSRSDQLVIEAVVGIARGLGKQTIAECVETSETADFLERQGVDYRQGYWVGRPEPALDVLSVPA